MDSVGLTLLFSSRFRSVACLLDHPRIKSEDIWLKELGAFVLLPLLGGCGHGWDGTTQ